MERLRPHEIKETVRFLLSVTVSVIALNVMQRDYRI